MIYAVAGTLVLILAIVDIVWTTLSAAGGGPLSTRLAHAVWRLTGKSRMAGPLGLFATAGLWVLLLWGGWALVFMAGADAVVAASSGDPADVWSRVYFAGYTVATLGLGDYVPRGAGWQVLTVLAAFSGLVLITLAVTYYTAVLGAVVDKQRLAGSIQSLGDTPEDIVAGAWDGDGFPGLDTILHGLSGAVTLHTRRHYAYPVVHYFRTADPEESVAVQTARLWEALLLWDGVVAEGHRPPPAALRSARRSLRSMAEMLQGDYVSDAEPPPPPDVDRLRAAGIPIDPDAAPWDASDARKVRRAFAAYVRHHTFAWDDVAAPSSS